MNKNISQPISLIKYPANRKKLSKFPAQIPSQPKKFQQISSSFTQPTKTISANFQLIYPSNQTNISKYPAHLPSQRTKISANT
jgi:hypothetical protein